MKYILIGYKVDDERNQVYEMDILACEETEIIITDEDKEIYHQYDILKVYKELE